MFSKSMFLYLFLLSILQASSPPSIMQVCLSIACFSIYLFRATPATPLTRLCNNQVYRSWGSAGHLYGRLHDQPTAVPAAHPTPRPAWPPSPSHAAAAAPAPTGKFFSTKNHRIFPPPNLVCKTPTLNVQTGLNQLNVRKVRLKTYI